MPDDERDRALKDLASRADRLQASAVRPTPSAAGHHAVGQAYQILGALVGGVIVGLAMGAAADWAMGTAPWGMIVGVLAGFAVSVFMAKLTADRLMAQAAEENRLGEALPDDEDEER